MALLFLKYTQITHAYTHRNTHRNALCVHTWVNISKTFTLSSFSHNCPSYRLNLILRFTHTLFSSFLVQSYGNVRLNLRSNPTQPASPSFPEIQYFNTGREAGCIYIYDCEPHPAAVHLELLPFQHGSEPTHLFTPEACASGPPPPRLPLFHPSTHVTDTSWESRRLTKKKKIAWGQSVLITVMSGM